MYKIHDHRSRDSTADCEQFQVQSNWVTQASQEDIFHSPRNEAILQGVAECSRDPVMQSRDQSTALQFQRARYLPSKTISEPFWTKLLAKIVAILSNVSILLSRSGKAWKRLNQLKWLSRDCIDDRSEPLFEDLPEELYLSPSYRWSDKSSFDKLDVKNVSIEDTLNRVRADLTRPILRMKASTTSGSWHHRSASLLILPFPKKWVAPKSDVRKLQIIPLQNGSRTSSNEGPTYHPNNNGAPAPTDLGLRLVDRKSRQVASRKALFAELCIKNCMPKDVIPLIMKTYYPYNLVDLASSAAHIRYLYRNLPEIERSLDPMICLRDQDQKPLYRRFITIGQRDLIVDDVYFDTNEEYGVKSLISENKDDAILGALSFKLHLLPKVYANRVDKAARRYELSWEEWLEGSAEVRRVLRLVNSRDSKKLSKLFQFIVNYRNDKRLGVLNAHWTLSKDLVNDKIVTVLSQAGAPCEGSTERPLEDAYLPCPELLKIDGKLGVSRLLLFVVLPPELKDRPSEEWDFLKKYGIRSEANLDFYLDVLFNLVHKQCPLNSEDRNILLKVYHLVEKHSKGADDGRLR